MGFLLISILSFKAKLLLLLNVFAILIKKRGLHMLQTLAALSAFLVGSFSLSTPRSTVYYAYMEVVMVEESKDRNGKNHGWPGHSYMIFQNVYDDQTKYGYMTYCLDEIFSIGKWGGASSSGGCDESKYAGIRYDYDLYHYSHIDTMTSYTVFGDYIGIEEYDQLEKILEYRNSGYNVFTDNCVTICRFMLNSYLIYHGLDVIPSNVIQPADLAKAIKERCPDSFSNSSLLFEPKDTYQVFNV